MVHIMLGGTALSGDHLAAVVEEVRRLAQDPTMLLRSGRAGDVELEFRGTAAGAERLEAALERADHRIVDFQVSSVVIVSDSSATRPRRRASMDPVVLIVDGDRARAEGTRRMLGRTQMDLRVVSKVDAALTMLLHTEILFDAVILRDQLPGGGGLKVLEGIKPVETVLSSVLVLTDEPRPSLARAYRSLGAYRMEVDPREPMQLIGLVHKTVLDTLRWRNAAEGAVVAPEAADEPPRIHVDFEAAAKRLATIADLSAVETDVAYWVLLGYRDADIAKMLGRAERTAKRHVGHVLAKAKIKNRTSLWAVLRADCDGTPVPRPGHREDGQSHEVRPLRPSIADARLAPITSVAPSSADPRPPGVHAPTVERPGAGPRTVG